MIHWQNNRTKSTVDSHLIDPLSLQLHSIFDALSDMIFYVRVESNEKFKYHFLNKAFLKETGFREENILTHYVEEILPPESQWFILDKYREAVLSKTPVTWRENAVYTSGPKTVDVTLTPWFNDHGQCTHIVGSIKPVVVTPAKDTLTDVYDNFNTALTYRNQNLAKKKAEKEMALLMNNTEESFVLIDTNFRIVIFNTQFQKYYKEYFRKDVKKGDSILDYVKPTKRKSTEDIYVSVFKGETIETEYQVIRQDTSVITFFSRFKPAYEQDGTIMGAFVTSINISEKKKALQQLQELQRKMDAAIRVAKLGYWNWNTKDDIVTWSDRIYEIYGIEKNTPLNFNTVFDCIHPDDKTYYREELGKWFSNKQGGSLEYRVLRNDGSVRYVQSDREVILNENGDLIGFAGSILDTTEKKLAENQIILEKELSDTLINSLPGIFYLYDKQGNFLRWNKNFETVSGYSAQEIASMKPIDFFDTDEKELLREKIRNVFHTGEDTVEASFLSKNKKKTRYYFTGNLITFEGKPCLIGVGFDSSEKIQAQELLQKTNAHLVSAQQIARLGYWELNLKNRSSYWSEQMYKICGVHKNKSITTIGTFINLVHPDDKAILLDANKAALTSNQAQNIEFRIIHKDGSIHHLMATINHIADDSGTPLRLEGTLQDITERKDYIEKIENQNKTLREIAWMQSHTVRAPLARIMGLVNLLNLMKTHPCPEMTAGELANQIVICADELDQIIRQIVRKTEQVNNPL